MPNKIGVATALWAMLLVNYLDRVAMSFAGPSIMKSLAVSPAQFGIILSSFSVGYCLAQIPGGLLADRLGSKALLVGGPLFWALFTGVTGLATTVVGFVVARLLFGIAEGLSATSYYKAVGENFDARMRARVLAICSSAIALAPAFAGALVGKLIGAFGWQVMFMLMAIPALISALVSFFLLPGTVTVPAPPPASMSESADDDELSLGQILRQPSLWLLSLAALCWAIPYWGYLGWMPSYLQMARGIDLKTSGAIASIPYVFAFIGMLTGGFLASTVFHKYCPQLVAFNFLCAGISLIFAYRALDVYTSLVGLSSAAFFLFGCQGITGKIVLDFAPDRNRAGYVGIFNTAGQIGGIAAPAVIGILVSATGTFAGGFIFMVGALAVSAICVLLLIPMLATRSQTGGPAVALRAA